VEFIRSASILSKLKHKDTWFGTTYSMNLYRGCQHNCIYCDSRSECYGIENFNTIQVKENAHELLAKELKRKKRKETIGFGSMNDPYMPIENKLKYTRKALEILYTFNWPIHLITKGTLVLRDIDLLQSLSRNYAAVSLTITTPHDSLSKQIEPAAPASSERLACVNELANKGIYTGVLLMPVLPFINDKAEDIKLLVEKVKAAGASYIIAAFGVTLRDRQRNYFYNQLDQRFPGLKTKYQKEFGNIYNASIKDKSMYSQFSEWCNKLDIPTRMQFHKQETSNQLKLF
jgi:DNA repair photolyase